METKILRLLIVDPSPDDAELTLSALRKGGYLLKSQRVHDLAGLHAAIGKGEWDAVLTELSLSRFNANTVFDALRHARIDRPVIVVTRAIPDADIAALMRAGIRDVVLKNQMARLLPALERELAVAAERAQHRITAQTLKEIQDKHRAVVDGAREAIGYIHEGMHIDANKAYLDLFGYASASDLEGIPAMNLVEKNDHPRFKQFIRKSDEPSASPVEFTAVRQDGTTFHAEFSISPITMNGEACTQVLVTDVSKRKAVETKLQHMNQHDPLTGIYNRAYFTQVLDQAIEAARKNGASQGVLYVNVGPLRQAGRDLGQAAVDRFLLNATRVLREATGAQALLARWGDREFLAIVPEAQISKLGTLGRGAEKSISDLSIGDEGSDKCACSVATRPIDGSPDNAQALVAMLLSAASDSSDAEGQSKSTAVLSQRRAPPPGSGKPTLAAVPKPDNINWPERVRAAIERESFRLIYQPIINLHGDAGEYFEVLVRMVGDDGALIPAAQFFPHAEASGQAVAIDRWVVKHSIYALAELHRQQRDVKFFVNLSVGALRDVELVVSAQQVLHETKLSGEHVIFEFDEVALAKHADAATTFMRAAKKLGCSFCIDNFGRTLGATTRLREPPIEYLKLDAGLVRNLSGDNVAQTSLRAVVEVAKAIEKKTIAKSVESAEALSVLWTVGIDYVQGHYFQEADSDLNYAFSDETTISSEASPQWTVASSGKSR